MLGQRSVYTVITWVNRAWRRLPTPPILNTTSTVPVPEGWLCAALPSRAGWAGQRDWSVWSAPPPPPPRLQGRPSPTPPPRAVSGSGPGREE